jgi:hypothetical protein
LRKSFAEKNAAFKAIRRSDKVIYYSHKTPDSPLKGIVGLFEVKSNGDWKSIKGTGRVWAYEISSLFLANEGHKPREFSPKNDVGLSLKPMGTVVELKPEQYGKIKSFLLGMDEPTNHEGLVALFSKIHTYLGFPKIKKIGMHYPDAIAIDADGKEKRLEFEFDSSSFPKEGHNPKECDVIVCWKDGWGFARPKRLQLIELQPHYGF